MEYEGKITVMGLEINTIRGHVSNTERAEGLVWWRLHFYHPMAWQIEGEIKFNVRKKFSFHIHSRVWPTTQPCQPRKALGAWNTCSFMFLGLCLMPDPWRGLCWFLLIKQPFLLRDLLASFPHCIFLTAYFSPHSAWTLDICLFRCKLHERGVIVSPASRTVMALGPVLNDVCWMDLEWMKKDPMKGGEKGPHPGMEIAFRKCCFLIQEPRDGGGEGKGTEGL